jgi:hypothetical protein
MVASIPASAIVDINPNVIAAGGTGLTLSGLMLTASTRVPVGQVMAFSSLADVSAYFGPVSTEATLAALYFAGFTGSTIKPARLFFKQYVQAPVAAYLRGGPLASLATLNAQSGVLTLTIDGRSITTGTINLSSATSYSQVASLIQAALTGYDAVFTGQIASTTLTITAMTSGTVAPGQVISGVGIVVGTKIVSQLTGTIGGIGTYQVDTVQSASSQTISAGPATVVYDSVSNAIVITGGTPGSGQTVTVASGSLAAPLGLTVTTGAVTSAGAGIFTPAGAMDATLAQTQNFASFMTLFKPSVTDMLAFAAWTNAQDDRFVYAAWDNDTIPTGSTDTTSFSYQVNLAGYSGTCPLWDATNGASLAAATMGNIASINFDQTNGRATLAFKTTAGIVPGVTSQTIATNLQANGYNFYGAYASAADGWQFLYPGQVSGPYEWLDSYVNQIQLNDALQVALMDLLTTANSVPFNADGYALVEAAMLDPVQSGVNFGSIRAGVTLSNDQIAQINAAAGKPIANTVQTRGWYIQVIPASPNVRAQRGPLQVYLFYADGQSVHRIVATSDLVQ